MGKSGDQRTRMTKQLIRKAFMELLREKPIQSISIRELCGLAGINRGLFIHIIKIFMTCLSR